MAMRCDVCKKKEATVFLTKMMEGVVQKLNLCEPCSKIQGVQDPMGFALADLLLRLEAVQEIECSVCGFSQSAFKKKGRLGCSACYNSFFEELGTILLNMHQSDLHIGKIPAKVDHAYEKELELKSFKKALQEAIKKEQYEVAALLRDQILQVEAEAKAVASKEVLEQSSLLKEKDPPKRKKRTSAKKIPSASLSKEDKEEPPLS